MTNPRDDERQWREESSATPPGGGDWRGQAPRPVGSQRFATDEPIVRDKRRIDPETGALRPEAVTPPAAGRPGPGAAHPNAGQSAGRNTGQSTGQNRGPAAGQGSGSVEAAAETAGADQAQPAPAGADGSPGGDAEKWQAQLAERTADLQRLQAEYVNYRRRVERDREAVRELAMIGVLAELLPVLDDIGRAREHGELEGGFKSVAESLEATMAKLGLERFGQAGEVFDPTVHEALMHTYSAEVAESTCVEILQPGYRVGTRVIRPARVTVAEPSAGEDGES